MRAEFPCSARSQERRVELRSRSGHLAQYEIDDASISPAGSVEGGGLRLFPRSRFKSLLARPRSGWDLRSQCFDRRTASCQPRTNSTTRGLRIPLNLIPATSRGFGLAEQSSP